MRVFIKNISLFLLPLGILFLPALTILFISGEFISNASIGTLARDAHPILVGQAYTNFRAEYQLKETSIRNPEVITLGSSRIGQFRSEFFKDPTSFYNTSGSVGALSGFTHFINHLPQPPRIIIAGMDQYFFQPENAGNNVVARPDPFSASSQIYDPFFESIFRNGGWWKVYADYARGKFSFVQLSNRRNDVSVIGLRALTTDGGFTNDGSDYYGDIIDHPSHQPKILANIDALAASITETHGDEYGAGISNDALRELRVFLSLCRGNGVVVIGILPPIAHKEYVALQQYSNASYAFAFKNLAPVLAGIYKEYGFDFYDFSDISSFGSSDNEMVEAKHGGEKMYLRMFIRMAENILALSPLVDIPYLKDRLMPATSTYYVFGL